MPKASGTYIKVSVKLQGDFNSTSEYATVYIDGTSYGKQQGSTSQCSGTDTKDYTTVPASVVSDGKLDVKTVNSSSVGGSFCSPQYVEVTVSYSSAC